MQTNLVLLFEHGKHFPVCWPPNHTLSSNADINAVKPNKYLRQAVLARKVRVPTSN